MDRLFTNLIWIALIIIAFWAYAVYTGDSGSPAAVRPSNISKAPEVLVLPGVKHLSSKGRRERNHVLDELAQNSGSGYYSIGQGSRPLLNWTEVWNQLPWSVRGYHRAETRAWLSARLPASYGINSYNAIDPSSGRQRDPSWV